MKYIDNVAILTTQSLESKKSEPKKDEKWTKERTLTSSSFGAFRAFLSLSLSLSLFSDSFSLKHKCSLSLFLSLSVSLSLSKGRNMKHR